MASAPKLPSAHHVNNFIAVSRVDGRAGPLRSGQNFKIALDRNPVRRQSEMRQQSGNIEPGWNLARRSIDHNLDSSGHFNTVSETRPACFILRWNLNSP